MASTVGLNTAPVLHRIGTETDLRLLSCLPAVCRELRRWRHRAELLKLLPEGRKLTEAEELFAARASFSSLPGRALRSDRSDRPARPHGLRLLPGWLQDSAHALFARVQSLCLGDGVGARHRCP